MPKEYNDYGLTTWKIGSEEPKDPKDQVSMDAMIPGEQSEDQWSGENPTEHYQAETLTFVTKDAISVRASKDKSDEENVSYDVGVGLPVAYGGAAWLDISADSAYGYKAEYYTYELVDKGVVSTASEAQKPGTATPSIVHELHETGNAWLEGKSEAGMDFIRPGQMKIRITGTETRTGAWVPLTEGDKNGRMIDITGANGRYEFEVPVVNAKAPEADDRLYRYRVILYQPDENETMIWSDYRTGHGTADSDVIPSNAFMELNRDVLEKEHGELFENGRIPDGTELTLNGIYDPSADDQGLISPVGDVYGMEKNGNYRMAASAEFEVYDETETSVAARALALFGRKKHDADWIPDLRYIRDCLDMDAGLRLQDKLPEPTPEKPQSPDRGHHSGGGSGKVTGHAVKQDPVIQPFKEATSSDVPKDQNEEPPFFGIPKTGVVPIGITALTIAAIAGAVMFMTRSKDEEEKKGKKGKNKRHEN